MYAKTILPNQLRVVTHDMKGRDSISIGILVGTGGRHENDRIKGVAHFLEHILFKGSRKYSCKDIKELIEGVGGSINAFTTEEQTCYFAKIPARHLERTFDILADMVFYPRISPKDLEKERTVILEEIKMYHDLPQQYVLELLEGLLWPEHPLGKSLTGTFASIGGMRQEDLRGFYKVQYHPGNIVVSACGRLNHRSFVRLVEKKLGRAEKKQKEGFLKVKNRTEQPEVKFFRKDIEQMHLALGLRALERDHRDKYVLQLLNVILGGNMSSRLFDEVREKRGLAYSISSYTKALEDTGALVVRAGVDNKKIVEALAVILKELKQLKQKEVSRGEFTRAKDYFIGQIILGFEDTLEHMLWIGETTVTLNKMWTLKEIVEKVNKVRLKDIRRVARTLFDEKNYKLALVGPLSDEQEEQLRNLMQAAR